MNPEWVAALTALAVAVFGAMGWLAAIAWRVLRRVVHFLDDYAGRPEIDGRPAVPGFMARLVLVEEQLTHVVAETSPNHGTSLRDLVHRTAADVAVIKDEQAKIKAQIGKAGSQ
jgi:hypothetical protein